ARGRATSGVWSSTPGGDRPMRYRVPSSACRSRRTSKPPSESGRLPAWRFLSFALASYLACVSVATYPAVLHLGSRLPALSDPLEHLWIMRWHKACLLEGRTPFVCTDIQYPVGGPLGYFPPIHVSNIIYIIISSISTNDIFCYNFIWLAALLAVGVGTLVLTAR